MQDSTKNTIKNVFCAAAGFVAVATLTSATIGFSFMASAGFAVAMGIPKSRKAIGNWSLGRAKAIGGWSKDKLKGIKRPSLRRS